MFLLWESDVGPVFSSLVSVWAFVARFLKKGRGSFLICIPHGWCLPPCLEYSIFWETVWGDMAGFKAASWSGCAGPVEKALLSVPLVVILLLSKHPRGNRCVESCKSTKWCWSCVRRVCVCQGLWTCTASHDDDHKTKAATSLIDPTRHWTTITL